MVPSSPCRQGVRTQSTTDAQKDMTGKYSRMHNTIIASIIIHHQQTLHAYCPLHTSHITASRPEWLAELMIVKESRLLKSQNEIRRIDWEQEDDVAVDEMLMSGQVEDARKYFEEKKATSVPIYRQTLRYHWTQTGK